MLVHLRFAPRRAAALHFACAALLCVSFGCEMVPDDGDDGGDSNGDTPSPLAGTWTGDGTANITATDLDNGDTVDLPPANVPVVLVIADDGRPQSLTLPVQGLAFTAAQIQFDVTDVGETREYNLNLGLIQFSLSVTITDLQDNATSSTVSFNYTLTTTIIALPPIVATVNGNGTATATLNNNGQIDYNLTSTQQGTAPEFDGNGAATGGTVNGQADVTVDAVLTKQ